MSLATRLTQLAQAVGADIKALNNKLVTVTVDPWHTVGTAGEPPLIAPWVNVGGDYRPASFKKLLLNGKVRLDGAVKSTTNVNDSGHPIFVLPVGYRPAKQYVHPVTGNDAFSEVVIRINGEVLTFGGNGSAFLSLCGIEFDTDTAVSSFPTVKGDKGDPGGTMDAVSLYTGDGAQVAMASGTFTLLPVGAISVLEPTGTTDFTRNGDGSITFNRAGWYALAASVGGGGITNKHFEARLCINRNTGAFIAIASASSTAGYPTCSLAATYKFAAGDVISAHGYHDVGTSAPYGTCYRMTIARSGGPQGPKGDLGGTMGAAGLVLGSGAALGAATVFPLGAVSKEEPAAFFTRNADQSIQITEAGWYSISAVAGSNVYNAPATDVFFGVGIYKNAEEIALPIAKTGYYTRVPVSTSLYLLPTDKIFFKPYFNTANITTATLNTVSITRVGGPQGVKGDPGGVNVVTTLDWDTAITPNFYRSVNDETGVLKTLHGPGDTLNQPPIAGIVSAHAGGTLVQRVWDLSTKKGYTRYKGIDGLWSAWGVELVKPPVIDSPVLGGGTPEDGDERYFQTAAMKALGIIWKFRYDKTAPGGQPRWVFVGGAPMRVISGSGVAFSSGNAPYVYGAALAEPQWTLPLGGDYLLDYVVSGQGNPFGDLRTVLFVANAAVSNSSSMGSIGAGINGNFSGQATKLGVGDGSVVDMRLVASVANASFTAYDRSITITPIRCYL